jgi:hypothetical protein
VRCPVGGIPEISLREAAIALHLPKYSLGLQ